MTKLEKTKELISLGIKNHPNGIICWSGGKDSMVLLHIMLEMGHRFPLVFFKEPWQPWKYTFHDELIRKWGLIVYSWHPYHSAMQQEGDEFEVQNFYQANQNTLTCPTGIVPPSDDLPFVCGVDILQRPKQTSLELPHFDCMWIGHKGCDSDPILGGDCGARIQSRIMPGKASVMFPLQHWTHEDVWAYIEENNVPYDTLRYEKVDGVWGEKPEKKFNMDYVHACTLCLDKREGAAKYVECPKHKMKIENISALVPWAAQEKISYMKD
jgi:3'-phosphoadenosine 5'-phosphosulfate sulfotransferase (PAPS reductase)/FAD synthetase